MDLEKLIKKINLDAVLLINKEGSVLDSFYANEEEGVQSSEAKIAAFSNISLNMANSFFGDILHTSDRAREISFKSDKTVFYLIKYDEDHVLSVLSSDLINAKLLSLTIKKEFNLK